MKTQTTKKDIFKPVGFWSRTIGTLFCKLGKHDLWQRPEGFIYCRFCGKHIVATVKT